MSLLLLWIQMAMAAWPDSYPQRIAMMEAFRLQFATPAIPVEKTEIAQKYARACELGFSLACKSDLWAPEVDDPMAEASRVFGPQCRSSKSPLACVLLAFEHGTVNGQFSENASSPAKARALLEQSCSDKLYAPACSYLGHMEILGLGGRLDVSTGMGHLEEGCKAKDPWGCYRLGHEMKANDLEQGERLLKQACQAGIRTSCIDFADSLATHASTNAEWAQIEPYLSQSCQWQNQAHCVTLAQMKMNGLGGARQPIIALALFEAACQSDLVEGCIGAAQYHQQNGDRPKAAQKFKQACDLEDADSCAQYGTQLLLGAEGEGGVEDGVAFLRNACDGNALKGCLGLAEAYFKGIGVQINLEQALSYATTACAGDLAAGCTLQGDLQEKMSLWGQGDASELFERGCELGDGRACGTLALKSLKREGFTADIQAALKKGCEQGDMASCRVLGHELYATQPSQALGLLKKSCFGGDNEACVDGASKLDQSKAVDDVAELLEAACHKGFPPACERLRPIAFAADFSKQTKGAFLSSLCQIWSVDAKNPEDNHLLAEISGTELSIYIGAHRNRELIAAHSRDDVRVQSQMNIGQSYWQLSGQDIQTQTGGAWGEQDANPAPVEESSGILWGESESASDLWGQKADWSTELMHEVQWPTTNAGSFRQDFDGASYIQGETGKIRYARKKETLHIESGCGFVVPRDILYTEHCSEVQALMGGYLLTSCD